MSSKKKKSKTPTVEKEINENASDGNEEPDTDEEDTYRDPPEGCVHLRPSIASPYIPSTVFVEYPPALKMARKDTGYVEELGVRKMGYKSHWERICIRNAFVRAGFKKSSKFWTALWSKHQNSSQLEELSCLQKVNHFPSSWCIGRKDRLSRTLNIMKRLHGNGLFDYHPDTYIMPSDMDIFVRLLKSEIQSATSGRRNSEGYWIMKPVASSCGRGISVVTSSQALALLTSNSTNKKKAAAAKTMLFQKYLDNPLLINKKKFDLRIYVLVTGVDPLRVYIHHEGLTRISTSNFSLKNIKNRFAHLTNYSVNKKNAVFKAASYEPQPTPGVLATASAGETTVETTTIEDADISDTDVPEPEPELDPQDMPGNANNPEMEGYKWSLHAFKSWLSAQYSPQIMQETFQRIYDIIIKTMVAMEGEITPLIQRSGVNYRTNCFELFGCDVILDDNLQPHLLEVNVSPSLMGSSPLDKRIKGMLIADVLHTVGMYPYDPVLLRKYDGIRTEENDATGFKFDPMRKKSVATTADKLTSGSSKQSTATDDNSSKGQQPNIPNIAANPFAFSNLSRLMNSQEMYRRDPCSDTIDLDALAGQVHNQANNNSSDTSNSNNQNNNWWQILVLIEDEMHRAKSGGFIQVHPVLPTRALPPPNKVPLEGVVADLASPVPHPGEYYLSLYRNARFHDHLLYKWLSLGGCRGKAGQKYLPRYVYNHIRNNLESQRDIYAGLQQVGHAHFYDPQHVPVNGIASAVSGQGSGSKRRARSLSASRPSSATNIRPPNPANPGNTNHSSNSPNYFGYTAGSSVPSLYDNPSTHATPPPVSIVTTTTLTMSPSGNHLQQQVMQQVSTLHNHSVNHHQHTYQTAHNSNHNPNLPPKSRPSSSRGRSYTTTSSNSPMQHHVTPRGTAHSTTPGSSSITATPREEDLTTITALAQDYYSRMSRSQRSPPLTAPLAPPLSSTDTQTQTQNHANGSAEQHIPPLQLHITVPSTSTAVVNAGNRSLTGPLSSASAPNSPFAYAQQQQQKQFPHTIGATHTTVARTGIPAVPLGAVPSPVEKRHSVTTTAAAAAQAAFAFAYGLDAGITAKLMKSNVPTTNNNHQTNHTINHNSNAQQNHVQGKVLSTASSPLPQQPEEPTAAILAPISRRRSLSAPSTASRPNLHQDNLHSNQDGYSSTNNGDEDERLDTGNHAELVSSTATPTSAPPLQPQDVKVLDLLRQRRMERQFQEERLSQLREYEEKLAMQIYQQQETFAYQQKRTQAQPHRQAEHETLRPSSDATHISAYSQTQQVTARSLMSTNYNLIPNKPTGQGHTKNDLSNSSNNRIVHNDLLLPKRPAASANASVASAKNNVSASSGKSTVSSALSKHLQWQQQQQQQQLQMKGGMSSKSSK